MVGPVTAPWRPDPLPGPAVPTPVTNGAAPGPADDLEAFAEIASRYTPVNWAEAWDGQPEDVDWLFGEFLETGTVNALFAKPGTGKSLLTLEVALSLAREGKMIVYVDDENRVSDIVERLQAFGCTRADLGLLQAYLRMYSFASLPPLDSPIGGQHLLALAALNAAALVVLDTTTRMVAGRENDSDTFLQLYRCSLVPLKRRGITVLRLDHPGKDSERGQRGSSAKDGDVDTIWQLTTVTDGLEYRMERTKSRSGHGDPGFTLRRRYGPLRHEWGCPEDSPLTKIIGQLDDLGVLAGAGRPTARAALKAAGIKVSNTQLEAAIRARNAAPGSSRAAGAVSDDASGCPPAPHIVRGSRAATCPEDLRGEQAEIT